MQKKTLSALTVVAIGAVSWLGLTVAGGSESTSFRLVQVEKGDVESLVSSTGALGAITTVEVGTQVSGQIAAIYADFNDRVVQGQLIARIDPTLLEQEVRMSEVNLARGQAELVQREREFERAEQLFEKQALNEAEFGVAEYNLAVARANHRTAELSLERAQRNLAYSEITAPISGVVVERNVDVGQTVAASLSAPQLFLIAEDLSQMEILVSVDESDIGLIQEAQTVRFTVQAYPDVTFDGTVRQVRLQSTSAENVVNYTVVVDVANDSGKLLPGMTATVDFVIERATDVFRVSNAALRFRATDEMMEQGQAQQTQGENESGSAIERAPDGSRSGQRGSGDQRGSGSGPSILWTIDGTGTLGVIRVRTGITDGRFTEITGDGLEADVQVIVGVVQGTQASSSSPFESQQSPQAGPRLPGS